MELRVSDEFNPWVDIWTQPRRTVRTLLDTDPGRAVLPLAALGGIGQMVSAALGELPPGFPVWGYLVAAVVIGPVAGILGLYVTAALLRWTGEWIGGSASAAELRTAIAWANVPAVAGLVLWTLGIAVAGPRILVDDPAGLESEPVTGLVMGTLGLAAVVLGVWSLVLFFKAVGEAQGFSAWKAWGNFLLAIAPFVLLGVVAAVLVGITR